MKTKISNLNQCKNAAVIKKWDKKLNSGAF